MSAQDFHGVTVSGTGNRHTIVNHSTKPILGYALQGHTATGLRSVFGFTHTATGRKHILGHVDFGSWAVGKPMQPGEERHVAMMGAFTRSRLVGAGTGPPTFEEIPSEEEEILSYELTAVLFADGTFYGPDDILADFSKQIHTARSLAQDIQLLEDKYTALQHEFLTAMRRVNASTDFEALLLRSNAAFAILRIWDAQGESEAEAALARIAALPDVTRGRE